MKLKKLLIEIPGLEVKGSKEIEIRGLCNNSKLAAPGYLFFAKKGFTQDGARFTKEAILSGAVAVVTDFYDPFLQGVVQIVCNNVSKLEPLLAERFYGSSSEKMFLVGVTGTNGKTTCSYLIKHLLDSLKKPCGLIGTIEWIIKDSVFPSTHTTPDILTNHRLLHDMLEAGCKAAVMEVSSHGLDQKRVEGLHFSVAVFTNLTQDHLDYHKSMEEYAEAKSKLFRALSPTSVAVVNKDSPWTERMLENSSCKVLTYGFSLDADVRVEDLTLSADGSSCFICYKNDKLFFKSPLVGKFNMYNMLAAVCVGIVAQLDLVEILRVLSSFTAVSGRLERVENTFGKNIFVDYAHTEDALKNTLNTLREISQGRLLCVFGCGGNRDKGKRPKMGAVAVEVADEVFVTSDNPRDESPEEIIREILSGIPKLDHVRVEIDRRVAICEAIKSLGPKDVLLIAGKGHENTQIFMDHSIHFDDRIVAKEYCK